MTRDSSGSCSGTCHGHSHSGSSFTSTHTSGWSAGGVHGLEYKFQTQDCTTCHGTSLTGGTSGISCDTCHATGWRSDCTFCHGGTDNTTGAPPEDLDDATTGLTFPPHSAHVETTSLHAAWDCDECHVDPTTLFTPGHAHVADTTAGAAEVTLAAGLSSAGSYSSTTTTCQSLYCHGDGASVLGTIDSSDTVACGDCHGIAATASTLSGTHDTHVTAGATCAECHALTASGSTAIADVAQHVDGEIDVSLATGMSWSSSAGTCTGTCHGHSHSSTPFEGGHASGWSSASVHGLAAKMQTLECADCHGASLTGGTSGISCDTCHPSGWRTDCTFCHGGTDNSTGAPPVDIDGTTTGTPFRDHSEHVEDTSTHDAWDCDSCHVLPTSVTTAGHIFVSDSTAGAAEVNFTGGLSAAGAHTIGATTCTNLYCHGAGRSTSVGTATTGATYGCTSCHGSPPSTGEHSLHRSYACDQCHYSVMTGSSTIKDPTLHVDGTREIVFQTSMTWSGSRCTGYCHETHSSRSW
jgi:predicted CxxxxCH...CXXCH cytochrome family protein